MRTERGSGVISGIVGMIFTLILLIGLSRIAELVILDQRLSAETVNSVRMLSVASHNQDPAFMDQIISQLATEFPNYKNSITCQLSRDGNLITLIVNLGNYSLSPWPSIGLGSYPISSTATSIIEP